VSGPRCAVAQLSCPSPAAAFFAALVGPAAPFAAPAFFAAPDFAGLAFLAAVLVPADRVPGFRFGAGAAARRSASSSMARCGVIDSIESPLRSDAFVSPSVTYGPNRPSRSAARGPVRPVCD